MKHTLWGVDIASTILLLPLQMISFSVFLVNHCSMSNDCKMSETPLSWDVSISDTPPQPCPLSWPLNKGVLAIFLQVYNVKISLNAGWSNVAQLGNVLHENFGPNDPIVWNVIVLCVTLQKSCLYLYFIKFEESENSNPILSKTLSLCQTASSQQYRGQQRGLCHRRVWWRWWGAAIAKC